MNLNETCIKSLPFIHSKLDEEKNKKIWVEPKTCGYAFFDRFRFIYIYLGDNKKGRPTFLLAEGERVIQYVVKGAEFWYKLTPALESCPGCLYYLDLKQCIKKIMELYPEHDTTWRTDARNAAFEVLGKRVLRVNFEDPTERTGYRKKIMAGIVTLQQICDEFKYDPMEVRKYLREVMKKPGGRWEWPQDQVESVKKTIQGFFK